METSKKEIIIRLIRQIYEMEDLLNDLKNKLKEYEK